MTRDADPRSLEDALRLELQTGPAPAIAATIDLRVSAALAAPLAARTGGRRVGRPLAAAPIVAALVALALGAAVATAALVMTAEDRRVVDLTTCMRGLGWNVANVDVDRGSGHVVPGFSTIVDGSRQQAFDADLQACATDAGIPIER